MDTWGIEFYITQFVDEDFDILVDIACYSMVSS